jgi:hypothetical protein
MPIRSKSASDRRHAPEKPAKTSETSKETLSATTAPAQGASRSALERLWRLANETERELQSARLEYTPDQRRIDRLSEKLERLLSRLLPYDNLQPVPKPPEPDYSRLTLQELGQLAKICRKVQSAEEQTGPQHPEPGAFAASGRASRSKERDTSLNATAQRRPDTAPTWGVRRSGFANDFSGSRSSGRVPEARQEESENRATRAHRIQIDRINRRLARAR